MGTPRRSAVLFCAVAAALFSCSPDPYPGETGKVMHATLRLLPKTLDPPKIEEEGSGKIGAQLYDGLLMYHPFARPYKLVPSLAEMPTISEDRKTYTFRIKPGNKFVDDPCFPDGKGREVTAYDFEWCFKRFAHPRTHSPGWWGFRGKVEGLDEWRTALREEAKRLNAAGETVDPILGIDTPVAGFKATDKNTFVIRLKEQYPQLLWFLAMPYTSVYPKEAIEYYGKEFRNHPVGTGPFRVKEFNPVYRAVLVRNPNYRESYFPDPRNKPADRVEGWDWEADEKLGLLKSAGKRMPILDGMEIRFITEDQPRWLYFKAGHSDFLYPPKDHVEDVVLNGELHPDLAARNVVLDPWPELGTVYACMNCTDSLLKNVDVRRAIALAYDHSWTVKHLYGGAAIVATSLVPPGVAGFDKDYHPFHRKDGKAQVEKAKEYLRKAGYPNAVDPKTGKKLRLKFDNSGTGATHKQFAERFKHEMQQLGFVVDEIPNTFPQLTEKMKKGQFQITSLAWGFDYPDAQNILQLLYGGNIGAGGVNRSRFRSDEFDRLYDKATVMEDSPERTKLYERMAHIVSDNAPWVTRTHRIRNTAKQPWLSGFKYTEVSYQYWRFADIDIEQRSKLVEQWNLPTRWPVVLLGLLFASFLGFSIFGRRA